MTITDRPLTLDAIVAQLAAPFSITDLHAKPGSVSHDATSALALAYADWRLYADRLDTVVGSTNWSIQLVPWGERRVIARLTILGVTKDATGEGDATDPNAGTVAEAQAKKRACAEFGLGRYLSQLPRVWGKGSGTRKDFRFDKGEVQRCLYAMYEQAGLLNEAKPRPSQPPTITTKAAPAMERLAAARAALHAAETHTRPMAPVTSTVASDLQLGQIVHLVRAMQQADAGASEAINDLGDAAGVADLATLRSRDQLRRIALPKAQASALITQLERLHADALTPAQFEERIALLRCDLGWTDVARVGQAGDHGVDVRGVYGGVPHIVQCKHSSTSGNAVGEGAVRDLAGALTHEAAPRALLVTSTTFSAPARQWAAGKPIALWDRYLLGRQIAVAEAQRAPQVTARQGGGAGCGA